MVDLLLKTKFSLPVVRNDLVARPGLIDKLNTESWQAQGFARKLTLVSAPAGFGKTTLVADWLNSLGLRSVWLSLDENDNDPVRFLAYLIAGFNQIDARFGLAAAKMQQSPQPPTDETIITSLINDLAEVSQPLILALDDYHVIYNPTIHRQVVFLLEHQPEHMHLVILTREDPLLPISRMRSRGQLCEIRQSDLRFTPAESAAFLQKMGLVLHKSDLDILQRRTEGWVTGLQLAALSMHGFPDPHPFIISFAGSNRYILDYLFDEIFSRMPPEIRAFLIKTSILDRLNAELCDQIVERKDSREQLQTLERLNIFIVALDPAREWYRYHHLFRDLLRHQLNLQKDVSLEDLHQRASLWFEAQGDLDAAVQHALAAQDWERSAYLIGVAADGFIKRGELVTIIGWCKQVPERLIRSQPEFGMSYAWALLLLGRFDEAESLLLDYETIGHSVPELLGQVAAAQAYAARARGDNTRVIEKSEMALKLLSEDDIDARSILSLNLGLVYWHEGRLREALPVLNDTYEFSTRTENYYGSLTAQIFLARTLASQGVLRQAEEMLRKTLQVGGEHPILVLAHYDLAGIYYEWNDLERAWTHLEQGLDICIRSGNVEFQNGGHMLKSCLLIAKGNMLDALTEAEITHSLSQDYGPATQSRSKACHALVALAMGNLKTAKQWVDQITEDVDINSFYRFIGLAKARLFLAQGEKAIARKWLEERLTKATQVGWGYATVAIRALQAQAAETEQAALRILAEGLRISQPEGFIRTYVDAGTGLIPLLQESARLGVMPDYIGQILNAYDSRAVSTVPLVEPLSERELEVLRLIAAGLSNREIAEKLIISLGTAKTHVHNVCGKLGARNRTEAAIRAKELDLV